MTLYNTVLEKSGRTTLTYVCNTSNGNVFLCLNRKLYHTTMHCSLFFEEGHRQSINLSAEETEVNREEEEQRMKE